MVNRLRLILIFLHIGASMAAVNQISIIPVPEESEVNPGFFTLTPAVRIVADLPFRPIAEQWKQTLIPAAGLNLGISENPPSQGGYIRLELNPDLKELGKEGYLLEVTEKTVRLQACSKAGIFYGLVSVRQLLPVEIFSRSPVENITWKIPCLRIRDRPRFPWRGMHLPNL